MFDAQENFKSENGWHVLTVTPKMEIAAANRINSGGFKSYCPTWIRKIQRRAHGRRFLRSAMVPLFPTYIFVEANDAFHKDEFESERIRLLVLRQSIITDAHLAVINSTALELTMAQQRELDPLKIKQGDIMQILHGALAGNSVEVLRERADRVFIRWRDRPEWRDVWVSKASLGRAV